MDSSRFTKIGTVVIAEERDVQRSCESPNEVYIIQAPAGEYDVFACNSGLDYIFYVEFFGPVVANSYTNCLGAATSLRQYETGQEGSVTESVYKWEIEKRFDEFRPLPFTQEENHEERTL